jgi:hypothetical protein
MSDVLSQRCLMFACPTCNASSGEQCHVPGTRRTPKTHVARLDKAARVYHVLRGILVDAYEDCVQIGLESERDRLLESERDHLREIRADLDPWRALERMSFMTSRDDTPARPRRRGQRAREEWRACWRRGLPVIDIA